MKMMKNTNEPKIESKVSYDERRRELTHVTKETREAKADDEVIGKATIESIGTYNESGIRKIVKDLSTRTTILQQSIKAQKQGLTNIPKWTKELKQLKEKLTDLQKIDKADKMKTQLDLDEKSIIQVKKDLRDIKQAIGDRLKL